MVPTLDPPGLGIFHFRIQYYLNESESAQDRIRILYSILSDLTISKVNDYGIFLNNLR